MDHAEHSKDAGGSHPVGQQQRVELLKALYRNAELLILDEPTAVLSPQEVDEFFAILRRMKEQGKTVIIITHKLEEVLAISDEVTVMRDGRVVGFHIVVMRDDGLDARFRGRRCDIGNEGRHGDDDDVGEHDSSLLQGMTRRTGMPARCRLIVARFTAKRVERLHRKNTSSSYCACRSRAVPQCVFARPIGNCVYPPNRIQ